MIYKFAILFSIIFIVFVMHLVRKNKLEEKYSILWVIASVVILIVSLFPNLITIIANKFNNIIMRIKLKIISKFS